MRKILFAVIVSLVFSFSSSAITFAYEHEIKGMSSSIAASITQAGKRTVAVVDFTDLQGNITELGRFIAEELSIDLTNTARGFVIIDRTHLKKLLNEHKFSI